MLKHKIQTIFEALLYIMLTYWLIDAFFAFNKYDWMLESGDNNAVYLPFQAKIVYCKQ